jgi:hypothetical protein
MRLIAAAALVLLALAAQACTARDEARVKADAAKTEHSIARGFHKLAANPQLAKADRAVAKTAHDARLALNRAAK